MGIIYGFRLRFSLKSTHWTSGPNSLRLQSEMKSLKDSEVTNVSGGQGMVFLLVDNCWRLFPPREIHDFSTGESTLTGWPYPVRRWFAKRMNIIDLHRFAYKPWWNCCVKNTPTTVASQPLFGGSTERGTWSYSKFSIFGCFLGTIWYLFFAMENQHLHSVCIWVLTLVNLRFIILHLQ